MLVDKRPLLNIEKRKGAIDVRRGKLLRK